jgi:hypothetical protein
MIFVVPHDFPGQSTLPADSVLSGSTDGFGTVRQEKRYLFFYSKIPQVKSPSGTDELMHIMSFLKFETFSVRQTDDRTTPKSSKWNITMQPSTGYEWGPADVASETCRVCTHNAGASGSAHFSYLFEEIRQSKLSVERTDPFSCILVPIH